MGRKACFDCQQQMRFGMRDIKQNKQYLLFSKQKSSHNTIQAFTFQGNKPRDNTSAAGNAPRS